MEYSQYLSKGMKELLYGDIAEEEANSRITERVIASNLRGDCNIGQSAVLSSTLHDTNIGNGSVVEFSSILGINIYTYTSVCDLGGVKDFLLGN